MTITHDALALTVPTSPLPKTWDLGTYLPQEHPLPIILTVVVATETCMISKQAAHTPLECYCVYAYFFTRKKR